MFKRHDLNHERFEELCAVAALGQISVDEYAELRAHLNLCESCRSSRKDFLEILHEHLPLIAVEESVTSSSKVAFHDLSYKQRFLQRTRKEGSLLRSSLPSLNSKERAIRAEGSLSKPWGSTKLARSALPVAVALLVVVLGVTGFQWYQSREQMVLATTNMDVLREEVRQLKRQVADRTQLGQSTIKQLPIKEIERSVKASLQSKVNSLRISKELKESRREHQIALANWKAQSKLLREVSAEAVILRQQLEAMKGSEQQLTRKLSTVDLVLQGTNKALTLLRQKDSTKEVTIATQKSQINELTWKLNEQLGTIRRERELLAAGRDIRDLMGARNLHIIDVADVDGDGGRRSLGRVFYTEGKSLIFYAYDMEKKKNLLEKFSLQAWGERGATRSGVAQSLGIFFTDDRNENQWMLKYNDPKVLTQIDSVFVTLEPKGGSIKPRGQKLMYAYLKATPNHP